MNFVCSSCKRIVGRENKEAPPGEELTVLEGAVLEVRTNEAPRIKCNCGRTMILLKGSL